MKRLNLAKGYLVNKSGLVSKKHPNNKYYCGRKNSVQDEYGNSNKIFVTFCKEPNQCLDCYELETSVKDKKMYEELV